MSRIGKLPINIEKVEVTITDNTVKVKGPKWELSFDFDSKSVSVEKVENELVVKPLSEDDSAMWGTTRSILENLVVWVTEWYQKSLEINWVWYKFEVQWTKLVLSIWYSHKVEMQMPEWISIAIDEKAKNILHVSGVDKQLVWEVSSKIRAKKKPEPYKGKWIKYVWEHIIRKAWKTWAK